VVKIRTAIENKIRPCSMLFHEQPYAEWSKFDFLLLEAYQTLKDETCSDCGSPIWICRNEFADNVGFKVKTIKCFGKAELEKYQEKQQKRKNAKKQYGETEYVVPYTYDGSDLPTRMSYLNALSEQHREEQETT
jgi:hypothetical protein